MKIPLETRITWFNHFVAEAWLSGGLPQGVTPARMHKVKDDILANDRLWSDVIGRHATSVWIDLRPERLRTIDTPLYEHAQGNFWGWVSKAIVKSR